MKVLAYAGTEQHGEYTKMNFEELRDRKLKVITTQTISYSNGASNGSKQSAPFSASTKCVEVRGLTGGSQGWLFIKFGINPTVTYLDGIPIDPESLQQNGIGGGMPTVFTFNVTPGEKLAGLWYAVGDITSIVYITEFGY